MKILVTGGAGFIGSHLVDELIKLGHEVVILDNLDPQVHHGEEPLYLNKKAQFIFGDVRDYKIVRDALDGVEVVFHEAALVSISQSLYEPEKYVDVNVRGTAVLMEEIINQNPRTVKKVVVASSTAIYGSDTPIAIREKDDIKPKNPYGYSKLWQEQLCLNLGLIYDIPVVALRYFNVYGTRQSLSNPYTGVCSIFVAKMLDRNTATIFEDGMQTRDFINVKDIVQANILAMVNKDMNYDSFNVGTGIATTVKHMANELREIIKKGSYEITNKKRAGDTRHNLADINKISQFGFKPKVSLRNGLNELVEWSKTQKFLTNDNAIIEIEKRGLLK